jgi:hypothetical protein
MHASGDVDKGAETSITKLDSRRIPGTASLAALLGPDSVTYERPLLTAQISCISGKQTSPAHKLSDLTDTCTLRIASGDHRGRAPAKMDSPDIHEWIVPCPASQRGRARGSEKEVTQIEDTRDPQK